MDSKNIIYAIIPVEKILLYTQEDVSFGRYSIDKKLIIWGKVWDEETLRKLKSDLDVMVLTHAQALEEMQKENWANNEEAI